MYMSGSICNVSVVLKCVCLMVVVQLAWFIVLMVSHFLPLALVTLFPTFVAETMLWWALIRAWAYHTDVVDHA